VTCAVTQVDDGFLGGAFEERGEIDLVH
jgi:hypothetical protein